MQQQQKEKNYLNKTFSKIVNDGRGQDEQGRQKTILIALTLDKEELLNLPADSRGKIRIAVGERFNKTKYNDCSIWEDQYEPKQQRQQQDDPQIDPDDLPY